MGETEATMTKENLIGSAISVAGRDVASALKHTFYINEDSDSAPIISQQKVNHPPLMS